MKNQEGTKIITDNKVIRGDTGDYSEEETACMCGRRYSEHTQEEIEHIGIYGKCRRLSLMA